MATTEPQTTPKAPCTPPRALLSSTGHLLKRLAWMQKDRVMDAFEETGLTPYHYAVLVALDEESRETQAVIADALGYDRSHLVGLLDELEQRALVERRRDPGDRRRHLVTLTPTGKRTLGRLRPMVERLEDEFLAPLDADERKMLHGLLLRLASHHDPRYGVGDGA